MNRIVSTEARAATRPLRILHIEHDRNDLELCFQELKKSGLAVETDAVATQEELARKLSEQEYDVALSDYRLPGWTGMDALAQIKELGLDLPLILVTGALGDWQAVECIKLGVADYVLKDQLARLPFAIQRAQEAKSLRQAEKRALEAVRESEELYHTLVENAPDAIVLFDVKRGTFIDCNENAMRLFRMTREQLLCARPAAISAPVQPDGRSSAVGIREANDEVLSGAKPCFEWMYRNSNGEEFPAEVHLVRLPSVTRQLIRGSIVDITDRKRAEKALRESEARYRGLVNNATYGIYWVTPPGEILHVNPALVHMLGYESEADLLELKYSERFYRDPAVRKDLLAAYETSGRVDATVEWVRKDGKVITVRLNGRRVRDSEWSVDCVEVMVEDVTERVALEKQLVQAQKFEGIGQLAGGIAHDFNNMIGAMIGWADLGMEETEAGSRLHRYFDKIRLQADRAAALTKQLLAFARRQILEPRDMDLNHTITETLSLLEKVIASNIEVRTNLAADVSVVRADPTQIEQVLMNLCINARDAMPNGGTLVIETNNTLFDEKYCTVHPFARPGHYAVLCVTDTGSGMDAATLDHIFEPFFTTKELGKGTGLGLATVYGVVRQHGGFVDVNSEPGTGTTFRIYFPSSSSAIASAVLAKDSQPVLGGTETILIAEDHEGLREIAREALAIQGYNVLLAVDGEQAVEEFHAKHDRIDLVLLDVMLPKLSGPEAYVRISAEEPNVPVIFATGYSADTDLLHKVTQRGLPVLQKPYSPRDLARKVRETLDKRGRATPHE
ncbi:MAG: response regulator [Candidatus Acidiferrales bacterium]